MNSWSIVALKNLVLDLRRNHIARRALVVARAVQIESHEAIKNPQDLQLAVRMPARAAHARPLDLGQIRDADLRVSNAVAVERGVVALCFHGSPMLQVD